MIIGTTPTHTFTIEDSIDINLIKDLVITYSQYDNVVFRKLLGDCKIDGNKISVTLEQRDTIQLKDDLYSIQITIKTTDDSVSKSFIIHDIAFESLDKEFI